MPNRRPSSSAKPTTSSANGGGSAQPLDDRQRDQDAERAVVAAGVAHGVEVRAEHQRAGPSAAEPADQVADRVLAHRHPGGAHPAADQLVRAPHGVGAVAANEQPVLLADLAERRAALEDLGGVAQLPRYVL